MPHNKSNRSLWNAEKGFALSALFDQHVDRAPDAVIHQDLWCREARFGRQVVGYDRNELVTNAIKYAYPVGGGDIKVSAREIAGHLQVQVSDGGIGLPDGFDLDRPSASLGFKVVAGMVQQLDGHLMPRAGCRSGATTYAKSTTYGYLEFPCCTNQMCQRPLRISIYEA